MGVGDPLTAKNVLKSSRATLRKARHEYAGSYLRLNSSSIPSSGSMSTCVLNSNSNLNSNVALNKNRVQAVITHGTMHFKHGVE